MPRGKDTEQTPCQSSVGAAITPAGDTWNRGRRWDSVAGDRGRARPQGPGCCGRERRLCPQDAESSEEFPEETEEVWHCLREAVRHQQGAHDGTAVALLCSKSKMGGWSPLPSHPFPVYLPSWLLSLLSIYVWYIILSFQKASSVRTETLFGWSSTPITWSAPAPSSTWDLCESDQWAVWQARHCGCDRDGVQVAHCPGSFVDSDASCWEARRDKTLLGRKMVNQVTQSMFCELCLMNDF